MKSISPLISAVLLIAFAVLVGSILANWSVTLGKEKSEEVAQKGEKSFKCALADFYIPKHLLSYDFSSEISINITVKNSGKQPLYDFRFSVITDKNGLPKSYEFTPLNQRTKDNPLKPGELWIFNLVPNGTSPQKNEKLSEIFVSAKCEEDFTISRSLSLEEEK